MREKALRPVTTIQQSNNRTTALDRSVDKLAREGMVWGGRFTVHRSLLWVSRVILHHSPLWQSALFLALASHAKIPIGFLKLPHYSRHMTKPTKWPLRPAKTHINLGIRPDWWESSLSAGWNIWSSGCLFSALRRLWSDWADAQADLSLRWAHRSFCWFCHAATYLTWQYS